MKKHWLLLSLALLGTFALNARPVDVESAKLVGMKFACAQFENQSKSIDLQLVYTGLSNRDEACFYVFNVGEKGFVIVSADDRFRPIVGYSDEGPFATENRSPELDFYLGQIIAARTSADVVLFDDTEAEWQSVMATGRLLSRNRGRGVDYICTTKWNQDSPYNLYAPEASGGPGGRCYAGCVATAMSQVMKRWDHPTQGTSSHSYYCYGYGQQSANFGATTYDWDNMPDRLGGASQEEIEAVALLMYHCAVAVDMNFSPSGSGANSWDVPSAIRRYFSYSNQSSLKSRDNYSLLNWQNLLKEQFDLGWPVYYSGYSETAGHAFVCDGYDDNDLFHFNWGWGGSSDGWFVIDEIDYAGWAQAVINYVPTNVYLYMPMQPENLTVNSLGDNDFTATLSWTNPSQNIHLAALDGIDQIVVTRNGDIVFAEDNVTPGAEMSFTDHFMPTTVHYAVYAVVNAVEGLKAEEEDVTLGPNCIWSIETNSGDGQGWKDTYLSFVNSSGTEIGRFTNTGGRQTSNVVMPVGHVGLYWNNVGQNVEQMSFNLKNAEGNTVVAFEGASSDLHKGLFYIVNNTCGNNINSNIPENLTANRDGNAVVLQWDAVDVEINQYGIYRDGVLYALSTNNSFTDAEVGDAFHTYHVTTLTDDGESGSSNLCNVTFEGDCNAPSGLRFEMVNKKVKLTWDAPEGDVPTGYYVYRRTPGEDFKRIKAVVNPTYTDNAGSQPADFYEYTVVAYYQATECTSAYAASQDDPELCFVSVNRTIIPQHLEAELTGNNVVLNWKAAFLAETYNVYRDGELIAQGVTEPTFIDEAISMEVAHSYTVTGLTEFMESNPSNEAVVNYGATVLENNENHYVVVYPNPTAGKLHLEAVGLNQVSVVNLMGQEVMRQTASTDQLVLDLSALTEGTYFIKAVTESGSITKKIVKIQ